MGCVEALANVLRLKDESPEAEVTVFHRGIRLWGRDEEMLSDAIDLGVRFVRVADPPVVSAGGGATVAGRDQDSGSDVTVKPDLVVLSVGVVPSPVSRDAARALDLKIGAAGFIVPRGRVVAPLETGNPGVYAAGPASAPVDTAVSVAHARAAAGKACLYLGKGEA